MLSRPCDRKKSQLRGTGRRCQGKEEQRQILRLTIPGPQVRGTGGTQSDCRYEEDRFVGKSTSCLGALEAKQVGRFDEDLAAIVQKWAGPGGSGVVGVTGAVGQAVAEVAVEILQIIAVAEIDGGAGVG